MFSYLIKNLVIGGPQSIGFMLDTILVIIGFTWLNIIALNVTFSKKYDAKEKLSTIGTPGAILVLSLILGLIANSYRIS